MDKKEKNIESWVDWLDAPDDANKDGRVDGMPDEADLREARRMVQDCNEAFARKHYARPDVEQLWEQFRDKHTVSRRRRSVLLWSGWAGMAACVALLLWFNVFRTEEMPVSSTMMFTAVREIEGVTLSGEDGAVWELDNQQAEQSLGRQGIRVEGEKADYREVARQKMQTLTVPRGRDYHLVLSDGTEVWVNAESRLCFPSRFAGKERVVRLEGEAYFKVAKDGHCPFIVQTDRLQTRVLGTEFNLKSYKDDVSSVTLVSGEVAVRPAGKTEEVRMLAGQEFSLQVDGTAAVQTVDTYACTQWKEGYFYFDRAPLTEILHALGRWYNVDIELGGRAALSGYHLHFVANRRESLSDALDKLNALQKVKATLNGNRIIIE